jgi:hypothetical protein
MELIKGRKKGRNRGKVVSARSGKSGKSGTGGGGNGYSRGGGGDGGGGDSQGGGRPSLWKRIKKRLG